MKILFNLIFFLFVSSASASCGFAENVKSVYSLSGPLTVILEELGLLTSPVVKGVSVFYPVPDNFRGEVIPGGVFLSPSKLASLKGSLVLYDGSQELKKLFRSQNISAIEFTSRNQTPREVTEAAIELLRKYLSGCDTTRILKKLETIEKEIQAKMKTPLHVVFFLGRISGQKLPELVIANDGLVLWLRKLKTIVTYPSELAYVNWSGAIINRLPSGTLSVGISEDKKPSVKGESGRYNLIYPGGLIPGIRQLEAWNYFLDHISR